MTMYRFVPFDEIDKHKWDSAIHYSPNGNIFGYHWYLKAVWRSFDAIVEGDYNSVMPIPPESIRSKDLTLIPELGPYSINRINKQKLNAFLAETKRRIYTSYPVNSRIDKSYFESIASMPFYTLHMIDSYDRMFETYADEVKQTVTDLDLSDVQISSGIKPETLVEYCNESNGYKNALLRIMYHAMHKGIGWSSGVISKKTGKYLALSFFVSSHNTIHEIYSMSSRDLSFRYILYDLLIRQHAGKPSRIASVFQGESLQKLGFGNEPISSIIIGQKPFQKMMAWFTKRTSK